MLTPLVFALLAFTIFGSAFAHEPIPITFSDTMEAVIFDGRWTHETEWKASSLDTYVYDDGAQIILRSAHQGDFIYLLLNPISDHSPDLLEDYAVVCLDAKNTKSEGPDSDDYCFRVVLGGDSTVYQGYPVASFDGFAEIVDPEGFIGIGSVSDHNDRYTPVPHPSYEFRIPTDLVGRESVYGFFFLVYDASLDTKYTYPQNLHVVDFVPSPSEWGEIYSPDKSLPEFGWPALSLLLPFVLIIYLARARRLPVPGTVK